MKKRLMDVESGVVVQSKQQGEKIWQQRDTTVYASEVAAKEAHPTAKYRGKLPVVTA